MAGKVTNKYLSANNGEVWCKGLSLPELTGIDAKITGNFEEVKPVGQNTTDYVYTGYTGEGSIKLQKTQSRGINLVAEGFKTGVIPEVTIITKLVDKQTMKAERTELTVLFTEFNLAKFEGQGIIEEEIPFKVLDYKIIEEI